MNRRTLVTGVLLGCLICGQFAWGKNVFTEGSSFETGMKGFQIDHRYLLGERDKYLFPYEIDTSTAVHGEKSLKLNFRNRGRYFLESRAYTVVPGKRYTLSLYAKADQPVDLTLQFAHGYGPQRGIEGRVQLTDQWQRYSVSGILTEEEAAYKNRYFLSCRYYQSPGAAIWIDAIQLEAGDLTAYTPGSESEINIVHRQLGHIFYLKETPEPATMKFFTGLPAREHRVAMTMRNLYTGEVVETKTLKIPAGKTHCEISCPLRALPRGSYAIDAELTRDGKTVDKSMFIFCFIQRYDAARAIPAEKSYLGVCYDFGIEATPNAFGWAAWNTEGDFFYGNAPPGWFHQVLKDMGIQWQRLQSLSPHIICRPEKGEIYDRHIEDMARYFKSYGINLMPTLGSDDIRGPDWMTSDKMSSYINHKTQVPLFNLDGYRTYLTKLLKAAPSIQYWETFNEPGVCFAPEEAFELHKLTYEIIKAIRPDATVIGVCPTSDLGGNLDAWVKKQIALGILDYTDVISAHGYYGHFALRGSGSAYRELMLSVPEKYQDKPWWDTETLIACQSAYTNLPTTETGVRSMAWAPGWQDSAAEGAVKGITLFIKTFCSGVKRQFIYGWLPSFIWYGPSGALFEHDLSPTPILPAIDAFNDIIDGGEPKGCLDLGGANNCFFVEKNGRPTVFFQTEQKQVVEIPIAHSAAAVLDLMGNPVKTGESKSGNLLMDAGPLPVYVVGGKGVTTNEMKTAFQKAQLQIRSFTCSKPRLGCINGKPAIVVRVENEAARSGLSGMVKAASLAPGLEVEQCEIPFKNLPFRAAKDIYFPLKKFQPTETNGCSFTVTAPGQTQAAASTFHVLKSVRARTAPRMDGTGAGWPQTLPAAVADRADQVVWRVQGRPWTDARDCSAKVCSQWDDEYIYFLAVVTDDKVMMDPEIKRRAQEYPGCIYLADCVEFFFDMDLMSDFRMRQWNADDYQILASPDLPDGSPGIVAVGEYTVRREAGIGSKEEEAIHAVSSLTKSGYIMEVRIPWKLFNGPAPRPGAMFGFHLAVDDDDTPGYSLEAGTDRKHIGRDIQMKWGSTSDFPPDYGVLFLE